MRQRFDRELLARSENTERDSKIVTATGLAHVSRPKADRDALLWKIKTGTQKRAANAILAFTNGSLRHTDDGECGQSAGEKNFDGDSRRTGAVLGTTVQYGKTHVAALPGRRRRPEELLFVLLQFGLKCLELFSRTGEHRFLHLELLAGNQVEFA